MNIINQPKKEHLSVLKGSHTSFAATQNWKKKGISNAHRSTRTPRRRATPRRSGRAYISAVAWCSSSKSRLLGRRRRRRPKSRKTCRRFYYICANIASTAYRCSRPPFEYYKCIRFLCIRFDSLLLCVLGYVFETTFAFSKEERDVVFFFVFFVFFFFFSQRCRLFESSFDVYATPFSIFFQLVLPPVLQSLNMKP